MSPSAKVEALTVAFWIPHTSQSGLAYALLAHNAQSGQTLQTQSCASTTFLIAHSLHRFLIHSALLVQLDAFGHQATMNGCEMVYG